MGFEVTRAGKNYITVKDPESSKRFRLKGQLYEQEIILGLTQQQLDNLRNKLSSTFANELNSIENDIERLNRSLGWKFLLSRWLIPVVTSIMILFGLLLGAEGIIKLYIQQIKALQEEKVEMETTVEQLNKSGGKMQFSHCGEKERLCIRVKYLKNLGIGYRIRIFYLIIPKLKINLKYFVDNKKKIRILK